MRRYIFLLIIIVLAVVLVFVLQKVGLWKTITAEDLGESIEVMDVKTSWVEKYYQPWPPRLILVPSITFRVKNITDKPIKYINFNANFRFEDDYENLGDAFLAAVRGEPIPPGEKSETIHLKSNYGIEGKTLASFEDNPHWKPVIVKLYAQSQGSQFLPLGQWQVSKKIDFEEPEPVGTEEKEAEKIKKEEKS